MNIYLYLKYIILFHILYISYICYSIAHYTESLYYIVLYICCYLYYSSTIEMCMYILRCVYFYCYRIYIYILL
jgi:hypothetical protein